MLRSYVQTGLHKGPTFPSLCLLPPVFRRGWFSRTSLPVIAFLQKNSAKSKTKNTTVGLIVQCSPKYIEKKEIRYRAIRVLLLLSERVTSVFPLSSPWHQHTTHDWLLDCFPLDGLPKRSKRSFFCKRGPPAVGAACPYRL